MPEPGTIYSIISCGLGNQLFQYSHGLALSAKHGMKHAVILDELDHTTNHNGYQLPLILEQPPRVASKTEVFQKFGLISKRKIRRLAASRPLFASLYPRLNQEQSHGVGLPPDIHRDKDYIFRGFWQSEKYFTNYRSMILDNIIKVEENFESILPNIGKIGTSFTSVHIRGGDYLSQKNKGTFSQSSPTYYASAISTILSQDPETNFLLFSDDFDYAHSLLPKDIRLIEITQNRGPKSYLDIILMSNCKNNIITNSTFSWWGAWLNPNNDKTVIAPSRWFNSNSELTDKDIVPETWSRI